VHGVPKGLFALLGAEIKPVSFTILEKAPGILGKPERFSVCLSSVSRTVTPPALTLKQTPPTQHVASL